MPLAKVARKIKVPKREPGAQPSTASEALKPQPEALQPGAPQPEAPPSEALPASAPPLQLEEAVPTEPLAELVASRLPEEAPAELAEERSGVPAAGAQREVVQLPPEAPQPEALAQLEPAAEVQKFLPAVEPLLPPEARARETQPPEPPAPQVAAARRAAGARRGFRVPRLKLRPISRLEGVELPLPPMRGEVVRAPSGYLVLGDGVVRVYAQREGPWGPLQPLVDYPQTQEIFIAEHDGVVYITAGIAGRRYEVELPRELVVERLAQRIAITAGIPLSERNPQDSGEYHGWRVNLAIPQIAGGWQISAARIVRVEPLRDKPLLLARLVALAAAPSSLVFVGPPGSGKTTALIGVLSAMLELWPRLRVSIVEEEPEVAAHVSGPSVVRYFSFGDRNVTANIRATRRYDRPDLLVVGELRGEEVPSWFEAAGSGIPVLTTAHSVGLADAIKRLDTLIQASELKASVLDAVRVWVVCGKTVSSSGIERGVKAVYVVTERGFQPVYRAERYLPEGGFLKLLPPELQLALGGREAALVYERVKERLGARDLSGVRFEPMEPVPFEELLAREGS